MPNFTALKSKEVKQIAAYLEKQYGFTKKLDYLFLVSKKENLYLANRDLAEIDTTRIRINSLGVYFGELKGNEVRLSIEGAQMIGAHAKKNLLELEDPQTAAWMKGEDVNVKSDLMGFVIIKNKKDILGCGKIKDNKLLNFVPKVRRVRLQ